MANFSYITGVDKKLLKLLVVVWHGIAIYTTYVHRAYRVILDQCNGMLIWIAAGPGEDQEQFADLVHGSRVCSRCCIVILLVLTLEMKGATVLPPYIVLYD